MKKIKNMIWLLTTMALVLVIFLSVAGTVASKTCYMDGELEEYYLQMEKNLTKETRALLNRKGFENSGVTVTRIVDGDGSRRYTVTVYHRGFVNMEESDREVLTEEMRQLVFEDECSSFSHEFLVNN